MSQELELEKKFGRRPQEGTVSPPIACSSAEMGALGRGKLDDGHRYMEDSDVTSLCYGVSSIDLEDDITENEFKDENTRAVEYEMAVEEQANTSVSGQRGGRQIRRC